MNFLLADRQDITRAGLMYVIGLRADDQCKFVEDKTELMEQLKLVPHSVVVLDYTLFDFNDASELLIFVQRFTQVHWVLFSEDLSVDFIRLVLASSQQISILMKDSPLAEIKAALKYATENRRFICQHTTEQLLSNDNEQHEQVKLTKTETEILKDIALGLTTKEIAEKRFSSFHTVNTHRKNIFRKLGVNNVHEATKYALRAGLIDAAEYYI
jgi:DNA-binding NarL/FixJ family response regulator